MKIYKADGILLAEVDLDDASYRNRAIMGDNELTLKFSLSEHLELPVGSYCEFQGARYTLMRPEALKMNHTRYFEYTATMEGEEAYAKIWKLRNTVDGRLKFSMTARPHEFVQLFVDNMNRRSSGWSLGDCIEAAEQLISFDHAYCYEALSQIADAFKTEFEIVGKRVSLHKVEYNKTSPLPLSYGKGNGFKSGVGRSNYSETPPAEILYVQGGEKNIDRSKYGSAELHLPKNAFISYDGEKFEDEDGFNSDNAHSYMTDADGFSIRRADKPLSSMAEESLDCSESYPKRVGVVSEVIDVKPESNFYDFTDNTIPNTLNYEDCLIEGETMTVIFQSGMLAGREFEVKYISEAKGGKKGRRFEIVPQETDGVTMPNETFKPRVNDTYAVFNCMLPSSYINAYDPEATTPKKEGAEWDMFREAVRYLYDNEEQRFTFSGTLDGIWAKKDWLNIGGRIVLGGYILFTDERFAREGALVRIIGIKDYLNNPHSPEIELSNNTISAGFSTQIQKLESREVLAEKNHRESIQFTKRRFRDAKETIGMLDTLVNEGFDNFTNSINPIAVQTMQMIAGDESLQFRFVDSKTAPQEVSLGISYDQENKRLHVPESILQHLTLDIDTLSNAHHPSEYRFWDMQEYQSARLDDPTKKYYLYAKVGRDAGNGVFILSEAVRPMESESAYYYLLVGVLNSEYGQERSFASLYGFTEILPGRITTDKIISQDGTCYFDLANNIIGGRIEFVTTDGTRHEQNEYINNIINGTLIEGGFIKTSLINADAISVKRLEVVNDEGQGVKIIPDERAVGSVEIFDEDGRQVSVFEGATYDGVGNLFGNSSGSMNISPTSKTYQQITASPYTDQNYSNTDVISPVLHTDTPTEITFNGRLSVYAYAGPMQNPDTSKPIKQSRSYANLSVKLVTYADAACTNTICAKNLAALSVSASRERDIYGEYRDYDNSRENVLFQVVSAKTAAGYHRIEVRCIMAAYSQDSYARASFNSFSATYNSDFYVSRYFANGFCLGSRSDNYVMVNHGTSGMQFAAEMGNYGFRVTNDGIATRLNRGLWLKMPVKICSFSTYMTNATATISNVQSFDGHTPTVTRISRGLEQITFPDAWRGLNLSSSNALVRLTPVDANEGVIKAVLMYIQATGMEIGYSGGASRNDNAGAMVEIYLC